jgi:hypothetical protein
LPKRIANLSLTSLQQRLVKTGGRRHLGHNGVDRRPLRRPRSESPFNQRSRGSILVSGVLLANDPAGIDVTRSLAIRLFGEQGPEYQQFVGTTIHSVTFGILGVALIQTAFAAAGFLVVGLPGASVWYKNQHPDLKNGSEEEDDRPVARRSFVIGP